LIGGEIASARRRHGAGQEPVTLIASGALGALYHAAFDLAGLAIRPVDADDAVRKGLFAAARRNGMIAATEISA
jgi:2-dehydro-3-deoxygalactonokinase